VPPRAQGPIPAWVWAVLGAVAAAAVISLFTALWVQLPPPVKRTLPVAGEVAPEPFLPLDLPYLSLPSSPTELPPSTEPTATVVVPAPLPLSPTESSAMQPLNRYPQGAGRLALVIDDMGMEPTLSARAVENLPSPITFAFMVEGTATAKLAKLAKAEGHALIVHMPMEPQAHPEGTPPLGPYGVRVGMDSPTLVQLTKANLEPLAGLVEGLNNHMGSRFTQWEAGMRVVLGEVAAQNLYFLDSRTAAPTATRAAAADLNMGLVGRDVFLDHTATEAAVQAELLRAVRLAQKRGIQGMPVVVIGHPLPNTLKVLEADLPLVQAAGIELVPLRAAVR
jgi:polysaccharide deacetylase 2 family uncharacterized protein YibQ